MFLIFCWLLVAVAYRAEGRVDDDFTRCSQFFFKNSMPVGFGAIAKSHDFKKIPSGITKISDLDSPAYICQTLGGTSYYATLYDRGRRIPLYSAYILDRKSTQKSPNCNRVYAFKLEPQLIYRQLEDNMHLITETKNLIKNYHKNHKISEQLPENRQMYLLQSSQAVDADYKPDPKKPDTYQRGHVNPCGHHMDEKNYLSTFTFTNVVPMAAELNNKVWSDYEQEMVTIAAGCSTMYVVAGSVPGNNALNSRVTIPSYVWNAYCCVDNNGRPVKSGGAIAANERALTANNEFKVEKLSLADLQVKLKNHLRVSNNIEIFNNNCKGQ